MKPMYIIAAALAATSLWALAENATGTLPSTWMLAGESPAAYQAGIDYTETSSGKGAKFLRHVAGDGKSWGSLTQQIGADNYRGRRVRFQAKVKSRDVDGWAGLWMRADSQSTQGAAFYNSQDKPIKGSVAWQTRSVVLDVPADAESMLFGVINSGSGEVWMDELSLEVVGDDVAVDRMPPRAPLAQRPSL
ncbi:transcriptional regulator [Rugamonas sp. CCM 8940]|uniref:transcriptional regulator n=1 Tax=Rugamonas sp. CCM 8940 TaxID=2765359 RepID=UPI0018F4349F|nr:transcriptional regulator [Rugamonas sp. CCM 8940]MBJ7310448.1 transcriptional regulator [Rugamonas sp. CCM 8940]